jgi:hypothetical protein
MDFNYMIINILKGKLYAGLYFPVWLKFDFDVKMATENKAQTYI